MHVSLLARGLWCASALRQKTPQGRFCMGNSLPCASSTNDVNIGGDDSTPSLAAEAAAVIVFFGTFSRSVVPD